MLANNLKILYYLLLLFFFLVCYPIHAQKYRLGNKNYYLRTGGQAEWAEFANQSTQKELNISFTIAANHQKTISFRQYGVKQSWRVMVNEQEVGKLITDENDIRVYYALPQEKLVTGNNTLRIEPTTSTPDDIRISDITIEDRPINEVLSEAAIEVEIVDGKTNLPLPSRITIAGVGGVLQTVGSSSTNQQVVRPGYVYMATGKAVFGIPSGSYTLYAGRGFEYSVDSLQIIVKPGDRIQKRLSIYRELPTEGWINSDTHIHTLTYSGHGDATVQERVMTLAGEGIELPVMTDHNVQTNIATIAKTLDLDSYFTPITGTELTTDVGHFNIFPLTPETKVPDYRVKDWNSLSAHVADAGEERVIILNHARDIHKGFRPFDPKQHIAAAGMRLDNWKVPANAMEVVNSGSLQTNVLQLFIDWFGMLNRGHFLTPVGSSDSHDVSRYLVGQARTYIRYTDSHASSINVKEAIANFKKGKVSVSFGLLPEITVNKKYGPGELASATKQTEVAIRVLGPKWLKANKITLYANGKKIREAAIDEKNSTVIKWKGSWVLPYLKQDVFLVAIAEGPYQYLPFWPVVKPFQPASTQWTPSIIGATGAVWLDADNDGRFTSAYGYAQEIVKASQRNLNQLMKLLATYDEAVAVQVAAILHQQGQDLTSSIITNALQQATLTTRTGFQLFKEQLKASQSAQ